MFHKTIEKHLDSEVIEARAGSKPAMYDALEATERR